jgi:hypothetical protein
VPPQQNGSSEACDGTASAEELGEQVVRVAEAEVRLWLLRIIIPVIE